MPDNEDSSGRSTDFWEVVFYRTEANNEPVRDWLKTLPREDRKVIGEDIKTVQFGWPLGMPLVRKVEPNLWEVRSRIKDGIARVLFTVVADKIVLLHGFVKKSQKIPRPDLDTAKRRLISLEMRDEE
jgi:phage-related protein